MQTKHDIQALLANAGTSPNKRLGQNFLIDLNLLRLFVDAAQLTRQDVVLEIGCGTGSMTEALAERAGHVIVAEYDSVLATIAQSRLAGQSHVQIFNTDALETKHQLNRQVVAAIQEAREKYQGRFLLVANLPYHISCPVMLNLVRHAPIADAMFVTVQKEVGDRMAASPGSSDYGIISILLSATGHTERMRVLKPSVFWPQPQVSSSMVHYQRLPDLASKIECMQTFTEIVELFMQHRRKMLKATIRSAPPHLSSIDWNTAFSQAHVDPMSRPERITPTQYVTMANTVGQMRKPTQCGE